LTRKEGWRSVSFYEKIKRPSSEPVHLLIKTAKAILIIVEGLISATFQQFVASLDHFKLFPILLQKAEYIEIESSFKSLLSLDISPIYWLIMRVNN